MKTAVVTGANRGIGYELARQLAEAGHQVFATCRSPERADNLKRLQEKNGNQLKVVQLDALDDASIKAAADTIGKSADHIDLLINNAGVSAEKGGFGDVQRKEFLRVLDTNTVAPLLVTRALLPLLKKGKDSLNVIITSILGSIESRGSMDSWSNYPYCASKAAVNMVGKMLSLELKDDGVGLLLMHPGWVATDMGGKEAPLSPEESAAKIITQIKGFHSAETGAYKDPDGSKLPW